MEIVDGDGQERTRANLAIGRTGKDSYVLKSSMPRRDSGRSNA